MLKLSHLICLIIASAYVLAIYLIPSRIKSLGRDHHLNIKYRMAGVSFVTTGLLIFVYNISFKVNFPGDNFFESVGFKFDSCIESSIRTIILMIIFYLGPFIANLSFLFLDRNYLITMNGHLHPRDTKKSYFEVFTSMLQRYKSSYPNIILLRNLIIAPVTEEICFRALMIPVLLMTNLPTKDQENNGNRDSPTLSIYIAMTCPIFFGVAHIHHFIEKIRIGMPVVSVLVSTCVQLTYTYIFGMIASILLMRTGNISSAIISHIICNIVGLPDLSFLYESSSINAGVFSYLHRYRHLLLLLNALGLILFGYAIFPFTESLSQRSPLWH
eukprot:gene9935-20660_t